MINATARPNPSLGHPTHPLLLPPTIQLPMIGPLGPLPPNRPPQNQQQQPQPPPQQQGPQQSEIPVPPQSGQDFTLSNVLHFLQTEWRRYERDRNEWEIERAEMRARIALLEGERRSFDNVKLDLMRRIKMLEYALRVERSKQLAQPASQAVPLTKLATLQAQLGEKKDDAYSHKEESSGSSPRSEDSPLPPDRMSTGSVNGAVTNASSRGQTWMGMPNGAAGTIGHMGKPPPGRDPKSRARSRDYLKQCLQEISYLTSPQAVNPLPNRPLLNNTTLPLQLPNAPYDQMPYNGRPRKLMPEVGKDYSVMNGMNMATGPSSAPAIPQGNPLERNNMGSGLLGAAQNLQANSAQQQQSQLGQPSQPSQLSNEASDNRDKDGDDEQALGTAIFRPDADFREKLRLSQEAAERARLEQSGQHSMPISGAASWERRARDEDDEGKDEEPEVEEDESSVIGEGEETKAWKAKRTLRNHLDAVRAIAFHPSELCLATGGDDMTVKIWRVDVAGLASSASRPTTEIEPQLTLRGHSAAITRLVHAPSKQLLYSASLDSSIRIWALPPSSHTTYAPYDATRARGELIGHTDAVWDLALVRDESTLISCGAEGAVKVWDVSGPSGGGSLKLSWSFDGLDAGEPQNEGDAPGATAVEAIKTDLKKVAVAYQNAVIKIFDIENGKELVRLQTEPAEDGISSQANNIVSHPTMPLLITGHEDKHIRIFDILTGQCTHSMLAHLDAVTSLSIDAAGFSLVSGSHDCSVRFWDVLGSRACVQEIPSHREKAREGVLDTEFHPTLPIMASAGADGVIKLYAS
ncbi:WD40 repeat-like protein [Rhodofomes roseus]|uniref:WD40 repeat-like protein n=1 Tax=Rhodofomes roseus TaxID=34475 RepID=A0ABQ8JYR3_9APHY|nr:WD40 repeat-like protein [Rhodofomes roseus]KAH9829146.1 WD40 repeat-like protein [Rhodofomes roseus]